MIDSHHALVLSGGEMLAIAIKNITRSIHLKTLIMLVIAMWMLHSFLAIMETKRKSFTMRIVHKSRDDKTKLILFWHNFRTIEDYNMASGSDPFFSRSCLVDDCYITQDRDLIPIEHYDAIVFHGPDFDPNDVPEKRSPFQKYVFLSLESPAYHRLKGNPNDIFNMTMTYRLDSDIEIFVTNFYDKYGQHVAPSKDPKWVKQDMNQESIGEFVKVHNSKRKPVAWFASNCKSKNGREDFAEVLSKYLPVDIYGSCGEFDCPRDESQRCKEMIKTDYFFYLASENSNCRDYVTEKVRTAYEYDAIPIVYGGANYSKFLPPDSYVDASKMAVDDVAAKLMELMNDPVAYAKHFWWKQHYDVAGQVLGFCELCEALHAKSRRKQYDLIDWWEGRYSDTPVCS